MSIALIILIAILLIWKFIHTATSVYIVTGPTTVKTYDKQVILECLEEML